jgi:hypothetical protein
LRLEGFRKPSRRQGSSDLFDGAISAQPVPTVAILIPQPAGELLRKLVALDGEAVPFLGFIISSMGAHIGAANV